MGRPKKTNYAEMLDVVHLHGMILDKRTIYLTSALSQESGDEHGVGFSMSIPFIKNMKILESISHEPITIVMNTLGGNVYQGFAIYDAIKLSPCHTTIVVQGCAMSMGSIILQAGDVRVLMPNSFVMFHMGTASTDISNPYEVKKSADFELKVGVMADKILHDRINAKRRIDGRADMSAAKFKMLTVESCWLTAQEAIDLGLADSIYVLPEEIA